MVADPQSPDADAREDRADGQDRWDRGDREVLLRCEQLVVGHRGQALLPPIDIDIARGELLLVVGRNGAGKSTWLRTVLGLLPPVSGRVRTAGPDDRMAQTALPPRGRASRSVLAARQAVTMTYVPQDALLDDLLPVSAATVLSWGRIRGWSFLSPLASRSDRQVCRDALERADATEFAGQPFRDLSGGQRQRVLFARLLASAADISLLDEPTASMDMASERRSYQQLADLAHHDGRAIVIITHTIATALGFADRVLFVDRDGDPHDDPPGDGDPPGDPPGAGDPSGDPPDDGGRDEASGTVVVGTPGEVVAHPLFKHHFGDLPVA